jgi:serine/threonine-protein kinase
VAQVEVVHEQMAIPALGPSDPMIGARINGFVIQRKLARGGMGVVYVAEHVRLPHIHKVIKVLLPEYAQDPQLRERFEREAEVTSRLKHDHILEIDDFGALADGQLWLMTPFLAGDPLDEFLRRRGRLAEHRALLILLQLCSALEHAHRAGIVHCDLKPANVFVCPTDKQPFAIKLLDFGIAKTLEPAGGGPGTRSGAPAGTPPYMALEQYEHPDEVTPHADLYAAAILACEMVTGRLPWGRHERALQYRKQRTERPVLDGLSSGWREVVEAALAAEPRDRPVSARAFAVALASETPAIPPYVPSGAEMLRTVAPELGLHARPDDDTMRNRAHRDLVAPLSWSTMTLPQAPPVPTVSGATGGMAPPWTSRLRFAATSLVACSLASIAGFTLVRSRADAHPDVCEQQGAAYCPTETEANVRTPKLPLESEHPAIQNPPKPIPLHSMSHSHPCDSGY